MWEEGCCIELSSSVLESFVCFCLVGVLLLGSGEGVVGLCRRCMRDMVTWCNLSRQNFNATKWV